MSWGDKWESAPEGPPALLVHEGCRAITHPVAVCDQCRETLQAPDVTAIAGPGGKVQAGTELIGPLLARRTVAHLAHGGSVRADTPGRRVRRRRK